MLKSWRNHNCLWSVGQSAPITSYFSPPSPSILHRELFPPHASCSQHSICRVFVLYSFRIAEQFCTAANPPKAHSDRCIRTHPFRPPDKSLHPVAVPTDTEQEGVCQAQLSEQEQHKKSHSRPLAVVAVYGGCDKEKIREIVRLETQSSQIQHAGGWSCAKLATVHEKA